MSMSRPARAKPMVILRCSIDTEAFPSLVTMSTGACKLTCLGPKAWTPIVYPAVEIARDTIALRKPRFTSDGRSVLYLAGCDLWRISIAGSAAQRS